MRGASMRLMLTLPDEMYEILVDETSMRKLSSVQEALRFLISEYIGSRTWEKNNGYKKGVREDVVLNCEDISQCSFYGDFEEIIDVAENFGESSDMAGAVRLYVKMWKSLCALFGFNPESTLSESQRERLNKVLGDDDPCPSRMRFAIAGLQGLVEQDKIVALKNPLNLATDILVRHINENF